MPLPPFFCAILAGILLVAAGASAQQPPDPSSAVPTPAPAPSSDHRLVANDTIEVRVFQEPDLDARVSLSKEGKAALALIGEVSLTGLTAPQAAQAIAERYKKYLKVPKVTVRIIDYAKSRFTILGRVAKPGSYFFPAGESLTLLQAIGLAGGFTRDAKASKVVIKRGGSGAKPITVDARKMAKEGESAPLLLGPGDVITVTETVF